MTRITERHAGYLPAWMLFARALAHVVRVAGCNRDEAYNALVTALNDGATASRYADTQEAIEPACWSPPVAYLEGHGPLLRGDRSWRGAEHYRLIEVCRADIKRLWPAAAAQGQPTDDTPAPPPIAAMQPASDSMPKPAAGEPRAEEQQRTASPQGALAARPSINQFVGEYIATETTAGRRPTKKAWRTSGATAAASDIAMRSAANSTTK